MKKYVKVWEVTDGINKWYTLYDKQNDYTNGIYNNSCDEVELLEGYELAESQSEMPYIYKNGFAYKIHKGKTGYMLYPAILSASEAHEQKRIIYI